jgi:type VI secretion system protein ImpC
MADANLQTQTAAPAATEEVNEFEALLNTQFKPKTETAKSAVRSAVQTLAEQALGSTQLIGDDVIASIKAMIGELDRK